jgi:hypothetical protein
VDFLRRKTHVHAALAQRATEGVSVLQPARDLGGERIALGADAHTLEVVENLLVLRGSPRNLGLDVADVVEQLAALGLDVV